MTQLGSEQEWKANASQAEGAMPGGVAILVRDVTARRLVEGAVRPLELPYNTFETPELADLATTPWSSYEMILADQDFALPVWTVLRSGEGMMPALICVRTRRADLEAERKQATTEEDFDGVLALPQEPASLLANLSLLLYAHRAFTRRYNSALEELHLNRKIFSSVTSGITVADAREPDMPLVYVNPAFEVVTGYCLEHVIGKNCRFLQGDEHDQPGLTLLREAIAEQREVVVVIRNYRKNGDPFWNELSLSPIRNGAGELTHIVGIQNDVTSRVEFERALRESEKLAAVGRLAAAIAHEINNPLESVMNLVYLAQRTEDLSDIKEMLHQADVELRRVSQITTLSLRFYKQSTKPQAVQPSELLNSVLEMHLGRLLNAQVQVERRERMAESIVCLESEIRQVLSNLIRNAVEAMAARGGRLLVRSREASERKGTLRGVMLTIADTGTGMSKETLEGLYTAFFTTKGIGGTGLGLWVSAEIVKRHHGSLRVRSRQCGNGQGWTVFQLFLPYQGLTP